MERIRQVCFESDTRRIEFEKFGLGEKTEELLLRAIVSKDISGCINAAEQYITVDHVKLDERFRSSAIDGLVGIERRLSSQQFKKTKRM